MHTLLLETQQVYSGQVSASPSTPLFSLVREFRNTLEQNYAARWQIGDYAKNLGVPPNHLVKTIRQATGETPGQIAQQRLFLEVRRLLAHSDAPIKEIAEALAFSSLAQFSHWFKKLAGISPAQFRQQVREMVTSAARQQMQA